MSVRSRSIYLRFVTLLLALTLVAACIEIPTFASQPTVTLRIAVPDPVQAAFLSERVKQFEQDNPTISVTVFSQMAQFRGNLASAISSLADSSTGLDLVYMTDSDFQSVSSAGVLSDLGSYLHESSDLGSQQFYSLALPVFQSRGRQMVMPAELYPLVLFYNQDLFDRNGIAYPTADWTVQDFEAAAKRLTSQANDPQHATYGFVADAATSVWPFVFAYGGQVPSVDTDPTAKSLTSVAAIEGFQFFVNLATRDNAFPIDQQGRTAGLWYGGRAGMTFLYMNGRNSVPQQQDRGGPVTTPTPGPRPTWNFRWDVAPVPGETSRSTFVQVAGYGIPKDAQHPDQAWQLIRYLVETLPEPGETAGYVPALKALANSPDFSRLYPESGRQAYLSSVSFGQTIPQLPAGVSFSVTDLLPMIQGGETVPDGLQALQKRYAAALEQLIQQ